MYNLINIHAAVLLLQNSTFVLVLWGRFIQVQIFMGSYPEIGDANLKFILWMES